MGRYALIGGHAGLDLLDYRKVSNISRTKSKNLNASRLIL